MKISHSHGSDIYTYYFSIKKILYIMLFKGPLHTVLGIRNSYKAKYFITLLTMLFLSSCNFYKVCFYKGTFSISIHYLVMEQHGRKCVSDDKEVTYR